MKFIIKVYHNTHEQTSRACDCQSNGQGECVWHVAEVEREKIKQKQRNPDSVKKHRQQCDDMEANEAVPK
jgi:hypothetical protein